MSDTTITIDRRQREPLHGLVTQHLSGIGDINLMIELRDFATAERYGLKYSEDLRMLDDLLPDRGADRSVKRLRLDAEGSLMVPEDPRRRHREDLLVIGVTPWLGIICCRSERIEAAASEDQRSP
jgi:hypothetical protein